MRSFQLESGHLEFASVTVKEYIIRTWTKQSWNELITKLQKDPYSIQLGNFFEILCHRLIPAERADAGPIILQHAALEIRGNDVDGGDIVHLGYMIYNMQP